MRGWLNKYANFKVVHDSSWPNTFYRWLTSRFIALSIHNNNAACWLVMPCGARDVSSSEKRRSCPKWMKWFFDHLQASSETSACAHIFFITDSAGLSYAGAKGSKYVFTTKKKNVNSMVKTSVVASCEFINFPYSCHRAYFFFGRFRMDDSRRIWRVHAVNLGSFCRYLMWSCHKKTWYHWRRRRMSDCVSFS